MVKKKYVKASPKDPTQLCIDGYLVDEVLPLIGKNLTIIGCKIRFGLPIKRQRIVVPTKLRKHGVGSMSEIKAGLEAEIVLDQTTPTAIKKAVKSVADYIGADPRRASFNYITLSNGKGAVRFNLTTKEMKPKGDDAADLRKKARVLGAGEGQGKVQSVIADVGAEKFQCDIETVVEKRVALCRKV
jgi:hypothetical protein